jgi:UDP-glucose 4-epimerase
MTIESKRVLVTGGAGFIGFHLARSIASSNDLFIVDNFERRQADSWFSELTSNPRVTFIQGDLSDSSFTRGLPEVDLVFHLAALNGTANFYERPFSVVKAATLPTLNLLERYSSSNLDRFVFTGTSESYAGAVDDFGWGVPTSEEVPLVVSDVKNPRWSYAAGKTASEAMVFAASKQFDMPVSVVRYHNVYGPRMGNKHVIPEFVNRAKKGVFELYGASNVRSFIYISDAVSATEMVAESPNTIGEIVHVGTQEAVSMTDLAAKIMSIGGWRGEVNTFNAPEGSVSKRQPDTNKLEALTAFRQRTSLDNGLRETIEYYLDQES